jgi:hypothetical protein
MEKYEIKYLMGGDKMDNSVYSHDSDLVMQNKLFNAIQNVRGDIWLMTSKNKTVDVDTIKAAQALARDIKALE